MSDITKIDEPQGVSVFGSLENFTQAQKMIRPLMESTMVPDSYRGNPANCMVAMEMAHRIGKSVLEVMQNMQIVKGSAGWKSEYTIMCINRSGLFKEPLEFVFSEDRKSCYAIATRLNGKEVRGTPVTMEMAKAEGWLDKNGSKWKTMEEQMLMYRSATFFCRVHCPEVLAGIQTADEIIDIGAVEVIKSSAISDFNEKIKPSNESGEHVEFEEVDTAIVAEIEVTHEEVSQNPEANEFNTPSETTVVVEDDDF